MSKEPFDVPGALFNADVANVATVIIIMLVAVGWVIAILERRNPHLGSVSRGSYWGIMMFLKAADKSFDLVRPNSVRHAGSAARHRRMLTQCAAARTLLAAHGSHSQDHLGNDQHYQPVHHHVHQPQRVH